MAIPVGAALGYLVSSNICSTWGWRYAFIVAGLPGLGLALSLLPFKDPERGQADHRESEVAEKPKVKDVFKLLRMPDYNLVVWGYVA